MRKPDAGESIIVAREGAGLVVDSTADANRATACTATVRSARTIQSGEGGRTEAAQGRTR